MLIEDLDQLIKTVCPIDGIDTSGTIWFSAGATDSQKAAARALMDVHLPTLGQGTPPVSCTAWQIRKALNATGLRDAVEAAVAQSTNRDLKDGWERASEFRSNDPFVLSMGAALGKSEQEIGELIAFAATL